MIFVIDTSVAVKWFVEEPGRDRARQLLKADGQRVAPDFLIAEVANVLWRRQRTGDVKDAQVNEPLDRLPSFFQDLAPSSGLVSDALKLARELQHSVYDCLFLALASQIPAARLVTADDRFIAKAHPTEHSKLLLPLSDFTSRPEQ